MEDNIYSKRRIPDAGDLGLDYEEGYEGSVERHSSTWLEERNQRRNGELPCIIDAECADMHRMEQHGSLDVKEYRLRSHRSPSAVGFVAVVPAQENRLSIRTSRCRQSKTSPRKEEYEDKQ